MAPPALARPLSPAVAPPVPSPAAQRATVSTARTLAGSPAALAAFYLGDGRRVPGGVRASS